MNGRVQVAVHWCHAGFELDGPERRVCRAGTWSDRQPVCLPSSGFVDENRFQKKPKKKTTTSLIFSVRLGLSNPGIVQTSNESFRQRKNLFVGLKRS